MKQWYVLCVYLYPNLLYNNEAAVNEMIDCIDRFLLNHRLM